MPETFIFYLDSPVGAWSVTTSETELVSIDWHGDEAPEMRREPETRLEQRLHCMLSRYFKGEPVDFSPIPVAMPEASTLTARVMAEIRRIPYGRVESYQQLAERLGNRNASRAVGGALGRNPIPIVVPCHRIVAKSGLIGGFMQNQPQGGRIKTFLLELEGHRFHGNRLLEAASPLTHV